MRKIAIFGGSFDPPTMGHLDLITRCLNYVSEVVVVPCGYRTDKHTMSSSELRYRMAETAISSLNRPEIQISDRELRNGPMMSSYILWKEFQDAQPDVKYQFVIGVDCLRDLHNWDDPELFVSETEFLVFNRVGYQIPEEYQSKPNYEFVEDEVMEMSSTHVRGKVSEFDPTSGQSFAEYIAQLNIVPSGISEIIESEKLYGVNI